MRMGRGLLTARHLFHTIWDRYGRVRPSRSAIYHSGGIMLIPANYRTRSNYHRALVISTRRAVNCIDRQVKRGFAHLEGSGRGEGKSCTKNTIGKTFEVLSVVEMWFFPKAACRTQWIALMSLRVHFLEYPSLFQDLFEEEDKIRCQSIRLRVNEETSLQTVKEIRCHHMPTCTLSS